MKLANLVNLKPLKEGSMQARELADRNSLQQLQSMYDQLMRDMEQEAEPEGGPIADQYADQMQAIEDAMQIKRGGSGGEMTYDDMIKKHYGKSPKGASPGGPIFESKEKWDALDVSRKAEKELSNKEWNERTAKKLDMLKSPNTAGKFKKDWDEEKLQGWVDQNYSWEKLSRQFKLNESYSTMYKQGTIKKVVNLKKDSYIGEPVTIEYSPGNNLTAVTISWGNEFHTVDFTDDVEKVDDHGNEGMDLEAIATSDDGRWQFILDVYAEATYPMTGDFAEWDFDELIIQPHPDLDGDDDNDLRLEPEIEEGFSRALQVTDQNGVVAIIEDPKDIEAYDMGRTVIGVTADGEKIELNIDWSEESHMVDEGSCGYSQRAPGGEELDTPGGTKGMPANKRTTGMMRKLIQKEIAKLHGNK